jgi:hypothetical protein
MHCVVSLLFQLCRLGNGSGKRKTNSHPFTLKLLSISIEVNAYKLLTNSKNILLLHEVVVKPMVKNIMHIQENEVVP